MNDNNQIDETFRYYRGAGLTLSATIIAFSTVLLGWAVSSFPSPTSAQPIFYVQAFSVLVTISIAFLVQYFHYQGYKCQTRIAFGQSTQDEATEWFKKADVAVFLAVIALILSGSFSIALWFGRSV